MNTILVLTVIGDDRPGLVESLSQAIAAQGGSWLESRMAHLAGKFAGILRASVPAANAEALTGALLALQASGLRVVVEHGDNASERQTTRRLKLELMGDDHPGIVRDISRALAERGINVEELHTGLISAPMSGDLLFKATALLTAPASLPLEELREKLEELASDLVVDVTLAEHES